MDDVSLDEQLRRLRMANALRERAEKVRRSGDVGVLVGIGVFVVGTAGTNVWTAWSGSAVIWLGVGVGWYGLVLLNRSLRVLRTGR